MLSHARTSISRTCIYSSFTAIHSTPCATLFPYTTLFRSILTSQLKPGARIVSHAFSMGTDWPDRKSTRLNSSHLVISYAAFCLKKKKESCSCVTPTCTHKDERSRQTGSKTSKL